MLSLSNFQVKAKKDYMKTHPCLRRGCQLLKEGKILFRVNECWVKDKRTYGTDGAPSSLSTHRPRGRSLPFTVYLWSVPVLTKGPERDSRCGHHKVPTKGVVCPECLDTNTVFEILIDEAKLYPFHESNPSLNSYSVIP